MNILMMKILPFRGSRLSNIHINFHKISNDYEEFVPSHLETILLYERNILVDVAP